MRNVKVVLPAIVGGGEWSAPGAERIPPGEIRVPNTTVLVEWAHGLHDPEWRGHRIYRVTPSGLRRLHNGWWSQRDYEAEVAARKAAEEGEASGSSILAPHEPNGRRRDYTSASAASRWLSCPGSVRLCDEVAEPSVSSSYAKEGTAAHEMAEDCLMFGTDATPLVGVTAQNGVVLTQDMVEHVQLYLDTIRADQAAYGGEITVEGDITVPVGMVQLRGQSDAGLYSPDSKTLRVYDLKYGAGILVNVTNNPQLRIYGLGGIVATQALGHTVEHVEMVIVQPRRSLDGEDGEDHRVRREMLTIREISRWYLEVLKPGVQRLDKADAQFNPSDTNCRWCPAARCCPALEKAGLESARELFTELPVSAESAPALTKKAAMTAAVADLSAERIAKILSLEPIAKLWLKLVAEHARVLLMGGNPVPGYKLIQKYGHRAWQVPPEEAIATIIEAVPRIKPSECYATPKILSPAQMEKVLGKGDKKVVNTLVHKPETGTSMVPEAHKGAALNRDPTAGFTVIET